MVFRSCPAAGLDRPIFWLCDGVRKIAALAQAYGKRLVPHHGSGNIGVIAQLHLIGSWSHALYIELLHDPPAGDYRHGFSIMENPPQGPGLGVAIKQELQQTPFMDSPSSKQSSLEGLSILEKSLYGGAHTSETFLISRT